jgi:hypothetical protein
MTSDDFVLEQRFFQPSLALTKKIAHLNITFLGTQNLLPWQLKYFQRLSRRELIRQQRTIAERLYRLLASMARNEENANPKRVEDIPVDMSIMLGFPRYGELEATSNGEQAIECLNTLSEEFTNWLLNKSGVYAAPWGEVRIVQVDGCNYLEFHRDSLSPRAWSPSMNESQSLPELTFTTR